MCPPSTAAISPGTSSRSPTRAANAAVPDRRRVAPRRNRRCARADRRASGSPSRLGVRTQTVTPRQLEDSLASLTATLSRRYRCGCRPRPLNWRSSPKRRRCSSISRGRSRSSAATAADPTCLSWSEASLAAIDAHRADVAASDEASQVARRAADRPGGRLSATLAMAMEFGFLFDPRAPVALDRLSHFRSPRSIPIATICWRRKRGWRASSPSPRATSPPGTGSGSAARRRRSASGCGADLLVGLDVRISDAAAGDARAGGQPARSDGPLDRAPADRIRRARSDCPGASRNPPTTPAISNSPINIPISACRASA